MPALAAQSKAALLAGAREAAPDVRYSASGYAEHWRENLWRGPHLDDIAADLSAGAGNELNGKLAAAHSSAALAVNSFGPWRPNPRGLRIGEWGNFTSLQFERTFPTGLGGTPPHLDLFLDGPAPVAIESKCIEWMTGKPAVFADSYLRLRPALGASPWFRQVEELRREPARYALLDAAQLVKHALGLLTAFPNRPVQLVYLFWEPPGNEDAPACVTHRAEAEDLARRVRGASASLTVMTYRALWSSWERHDAPAHLPFLRTRYQRPPDRIASTNR